MLVLQATADTNVFLQLLKTGDQVECAEVTSFSWVFYCLEEN